MAAAAAAAVPNQEPLLYGDALGEVPELIHFSTWVTSDDTVQSLRTAHSSGECRSKSASSSWLRHPTGTCHLWFAFKLLAKLASMTLHFKRLRTRPLIGPQMLTLHECS
jgi:hypothetical protein